MITAENYAVLAGATDPQLYRRLRAHMIEVHRGMSSGAEKAEVAVWLFHQQRSICVGPTCNSSEYP